MVAAANDISMGRFAVDVELANHADLLSAKMGTRPPGDVRREQVRGVVDSGATRLVIPEAVAKRLGLEIERETSVRYADGRTATRSISRWLSYAGRQGVFSAIVEPGRQSAIIGAIVMEDLDPIIDCTKQRLVPRDPRHIISEIE